ncbi:DUF2147 domain-containing protein [Devosia sp. XJ19-1]|uniref:DUF2147 domain-containing protein n=1 Tax=Devosia ureilytica TaxID=2952754 RepID=A0A9Q4AL02_9HYPH|nr:DUF2147 domain-containing protein [Devosia ureilytica]MCP8882556.1 DUF2147 domain-containing protein [Devosia ureilytica]MCP8885557.1 DUF2147 domain-containing protein [Devosia ureilytica]
MTRGIELKRVWTGPIAALGLLLCGTVAAQEAPVAPAPVEGVWRTVLQSEITISPCERGYCGHLSRIVVPEGMLSGAEAEAAAAMEPEEFFDHRNKDPALRTRPMLGLQILTLWQGNQPHIYDGEIYNPEDGNSYTGYVELVGPDTLRLNGCVLFNVVCRGEDWTRVPADELEARAAAEADAAPAVE